MRRPPEGQSPGRRLPALAPVDRPRVALRLPPAASAPAGVRKARVEALVGRTHRHDTGIDRPRQEKHQGLEPLRRKISDRVIERTLRTSAHTRSMSAGSTPGRPQACDLDARARLMATRCRAYDMRMTVPVATSALTVTTSSVATMRSRLGNRRSERRRVVAAMHKHWHRGGGAATRRLARPPTAAASCRPSGCGRRLSAQVLGKPSRS